MEKPETTQADAPDRWSRLTTEIATLRAEVERLTRERTALARRINAVVERHRRHITRSSGVGPDCQQYGIAVLNDVENDAIAEIYRAALTPPDAVEE